MATGRFDEADRCFDEAEDELSVKQMRAFAWVRVQRGDLARAIGEADAAAARYDDADRAYPGWWYVAAHRAALDAACGRQDAAVTGYLAVLATADRPEFREGLGTALSAAGCPFEASTCLESALAEYTASAERGEVHYLHHLAGYWMTRDPAAAVDWARRDVDVRRDGRTLSTLAECLYRAGRAEEARGTLREAVLLGAGDPLLRGPDRGDRGLTVPRADLVLEGGGVKGLGTAGAVMGLLDAGWTFPRVAGTSVGALAAAFAAADADAATFRAVLDRLELRRIPDRRAPLPLISEGLSLVTERGAYAGDWIHRWLRRELDELGVRTFADLRRDDPGDDAAADPPVPAGRDGHRRHPRAAAAAAVGLPAVRPRPG